MEKEARIDFKSILTAVSTCNAARGGDAAYNPRLVAERISDFAYCVQKFPEVQRVLLGFAESSSLFHVVTVIDRRSTTLEDVLGCNRIINEQLSNLQLELCEPSKGVSRPTIAAYSRASDAVRDLQDQKVISDFTPHVEYLRTILRKKP